MLNWNRIAADAYRSEDGNWTICLYKGKPEVWRVLHVGAMYGDIPGTAKSVKEHIGRVANMKSCETRSAQAIRDSRTRYEIVCVTPSGCVRIGFAERATRRVLFDFALWRKELYTRHVGVDDVVSYTRSGGLRIGPDIVLRRSGRTERNCAMEDANHCKHGR